MDEVVSPRSDRPVDEPSRRHRCAAVLGLLGGALLCWLLAPAMEIALDPAVREHLPGVPDSWLQGYDWIYDRTGRRLGLTVYDAWGRVAFLAYLAGALAVTAMPRGRSRMARVGGRWLLIAFSVGTVADIGAYWGGTGRAAGGALPPAARQGPPDDELSAVTEVGYSVELIAMLTILIGLLLLGMGLSRERRSPIWAAWVLIVGAVLTVPIAWFGQLYIPHGILLPVLSAMAIALTGYAVADERPRRRSAHGSSWSN